ncbi:hypothetical protein QA596_06025 [Balneolales bacterium ANBcel1]|nr:hypothetical protein [Balneolales bacterium ANBcel1]
MKRSHRGVVVSLTVWILIVSAFAGKVSGQVYENIYRPIRPAWQQLDTPHFRIIFQKGEERAAFKTAHILEEQYPHVQALVGGSLKNMPVVLNSQNDRSNGYVSSLNFRIEVEVPRLKGKAMNPTDGNWLNTVMPHELVHALHLNVLPTPGVSGFLKYFSPDMARGMHFAAPVGMIEGIAVFHESHHLYGIGGRGNHPYFTRQFDANFDSEHRWSLAQNLTSPLETYPMGRHYIGGYEFIRWLQYEYGMETTRRTIDFVSRWPFLGYGSALWYHTGKRPSRLQSQFETQRNASDSVPRSHTRNLPDTPFHFLPVMKQARNQRPFWLSENTLVFFSSSYDKRPGFYSFNIQSKELRKLFETGTVGDFIFSLHPDTSRFLYARYHRHPYYHNHNRMHVHELSVPHSNARGGDELNRINRVENRQITGTDRVHAPAYGPKDSIWALQTHHENNLLVRFKDDAGPDTLLIPEQGYLVSLEFNPRQSDTLFILGNRNGMQGIWLLDKNHLPEYNQRAPDIAFERAAIYDPAWHPSGRKLLFTSDLSGALNLYEFDAEKSEVRQLTDHPYGVMEGSYSPDGSKIAGIMLQDNRQDVFWVNRQDLHPVSVAGHLWNNPPENGPVPPPRGNSDTLPDSWTLSDHKSGLRWLRPRMLFPYADFDSREDRSNRYGLILSSGDVLRRNSYYADLYFAHDRLWYDVEYRFSGFYPGFRINTFREPIETSWSLQQIQGVGLDVPFRFQIDQNTRTSGFFVTPGVDYLQQRHVDESITPVFSRLRGTLDIRYQHRLQQNLRDVQPNTGWLLYHETEWDFYSSRRNHHLRATRAGVYRYLSSGLPGNRSLRLGLEGFTQNRPYFNITGFYSRGFDERILAGYNNAARFTTRYAIPLWYADRGWTLVPAFLDRVYLVLFTETLAPVRRHSNAEQLLDESRTLVGTGLRLRMRFFNIPVDFGVAAVYEPTRNRTAAFTGPF